MYLDCTIYGYHQLSKLELAMRKKTWTSWCWNRRPSRSQEIPPFPQYAGCLPVHTPEQD